jgi:hypothetical protein
MIDSNDRLFHSNPGDNRIFSLVPEVQTGSGVHPTSFSEGIEVFTDLKATEAWKYSHLVLRIRISGALLLLPLRLQGVSREKIYI